MEFACALATTVSIGDLQFVNRIQSPSVAETASREQKMITALITKLRLRGPLRWRELLRSQRVQKAEPLEKLLSQAIAAGLIRREGDLYQAIDPT